MKLDILAIDDNRQVLNQIRNILVPLGHAVDGQTNPRDGLAAFGRNLPDLLLLDVEMPGMDGFQVCRFIRQHPEWQRMPVVFLSGRSTEESIVAGFAAGGTDYIIKPFNENELVARVQAHGAMSRMERELARKTRDLETLTAHQEEVIAERTHQLAESQARLTDALSLMAREQGARQELVNAMRLSALGNLVAEVSHQVNTPLGNSISLCSHLQSRWQGLQQQEQEGRLSRQDFHAVLADGTQGLTLLEHNLDRLRELMDRFKDTAIGEYADAYGRYELDDLAREWLELYGQALPGLQVRILPGPDSEKAGEVTGYPGIVMTIGRHILDNMVAHAWPPGQAGAALVTIGQDGGKISVDFCDTGTGIDPEQRDHIWEPFYTTRKPEGFLGLGLFIAQNLAIGKLNGRIWCDSTPGQGTTIGLEFPASLPPPVKQGNAVPPDSSL